MPVKSARVRGPRGDVAKQKVDLSFLKEGLSSGEVVRQIGWLDTGFRSDRLLIARWLDSGVVLLWAAGGYNTAAAGAERNWGPHTLLIEFDDRGTIKRFAMFPDGALAKSLADWTSNEPTLPLEPPLEIHVGHFSWNRDSHPTLIRLAPDSFQAKEIGQTKHDFTIPVASILKIKLRGPGFESRKARGEQVAGEVLVEFQFEGKTPAGKHYTMAIGFPDFVTLIRFAKLRQIPIE